METRPDRFTAFIDANVLVSALRRNILFSLAETGAFRLRWSGRVLDEVERALVRIHPDMSEADAAAQRRKMEVAFDEACVTGYERLEPAFASGPDGGDAHVMAAAHRCGAAVIVTDNIRDFPAELLEPLDMAPVSSDEFIADAIELDHERAVAAMARMRARLKRPPLTAELIIEKMRDIEPPLAQSADLLAPYADRF